MNYITVQHLNKSLKVASLTLALLLTLSLMTYPISAKSLIIDDRNRNIYRPVGPYHDTICGVNGDFLFEELGHYTLQVWDNGDYHYSFIGRATWTDIATGDIVLRGNLQSISDGIQFFNGLIEISWQFNIIEKCSGSTADPGIDYNIHVGATYSTEGELIEMHFLLNPSG